MGDSRRPVRTGDGAYQAGRSAEAIPHYEGGGRGMAEITRRRVTTSGRRWRRRGGLRKRSRNTTRRCGFSRMTRRQLTAMGHALARLGRAADAIAHFARAVELLPGVASAHGNLGAALANAGGVDEALPLRARRRWTPGMGMREGIWRRRGRSYGCANVAGLIRSSGAERRGRCVMRNKENRYSRRLFTQTIAAGIGGALCRETSRRNSAQAEDRAHVPDVERRPPDAGEPGGGRPGHRESRLPLVGDVRRGAGVVG